MPDVDSPPPELDLQISRFLLAQVADQFCDLLQQEHEAIKEHMSDGKCLTLLFLMLILNFSKLLSIPKRPKIFYSWIYFYVNKNCYFI